MQTFPHTPAHAQHVPDGWSFPVLTAQTSPAVEPAAVTGGGAAIDQTVTRVKWGRVLLVFAGLVLFGFGAWNMSGGAAAPTKDATNSRTVSGGGAGDVEIEAATGAEDDIAMGSDMATEDMAVDTATADTPATPSDDPATVVPTNRSTAATNRASGTRAGRAGRTTRRGAAAPAFAANAAAATAPRTATGGGAGGPAGQLPMTGLETWIAAFLGVLLLAVGICVHVSAVRIATTALLYRRGILLRPSECARLAQDHGFARVRVILSDVLHRLLEEPAHGGDFVSARPAN